MNFDLIKKLIRLANNNPNENEANLAARKVCSLLADHDFERVAPKSNKAWYPEETFSELYRRAREQREKQEKEQKKDPKKEPWVYEPSKAQEDFFKDFFKNIKWTGFNSGQENYKPPEWMPNEYKPNPPRPEIRLRKCIQCEKEVITRRVTTVFRCNECEWNDYIRTRAAKP